MLPAWAQAVLNRGRSSDGQCSELRGISPGVAKIHRIACSSGWFRLGGRFDKLEPAQCVPHPIAAYLPSPVVFHAMPNVLNATPLPVPDSDSLRFLPEGPYANANGRFSWVGIQHGANATTGSLNIYDMVARSNQSHDLPGRPGFAFPCGDGDAFVVGCERSLGIFRVSNQSWEVFCEGVDDDVTNTIINDGMVFEDNLIFGTKDLEFATEKAGLYLYRGRDRQLIRLRDDQVCSNGKAVRMAADGCIRLIDIDSPTRRIVSYPLDIDTAILGDAEVLLDLTDDPAVPDGMILSPDGESAIVSMFLPKAAEFGETRLYDLKTGVLETVWRTQGSPQNTCPALVPCGDKVQLIITTAIENMNEADRAACPNAGQLFSGETEYAVADVELPPAWTL